MMPRGVYDRKKTKNVVQPDAQPNAGSTSIGYAGIAFGRQRAMEMAISIDRTGDVGKVIIGANKILAFLIGG